MTYVPYHQGGRIFDGPLGRSTARFYDDVAGEDEFSQVASSIGVFRETGISGLLENSQIDDPADLNLVPWLNLPRRARHRNEGACLLWRQEPRRLPGHPA